MHASAITLPDGVTQTITDRDPTMCSIAPPTVSAAADRGRTEAEAPAADEVPTAGDEEEGGEE